MELKALEEKFQKSIHILIEDLSKIHAGRVAPAILKPLVIVDDEGHKHTAMEIGLVRVVNTRTLAIKPWQTEHIPCIEKAVRGSNLGINPVTIDNEVQLPFPELTQERRKELAKSINTFATNTKNALRAIRHDFIKENKKPSKEEEVKFEKDVQKIIDKFNAEIDDHVEKKQKEIMHL